MSIKDIPGIMSPLPLKERCPNCSGTGEITDLQEKGYMIFCALCKGTGWVDVTGPNAEPWGV